MSPIRNKNKTSMGVMQSYCDDETEDLLKRPDLEQPKEMISDISEPHQRVHRNARNLSQLERDVNNPPEA